MSDQVRSDQVRPRPGQVMLDLFRSGKVRSGQVKSAQGKVRSGKVWSSVDSVRLRSSQDTSKPGQSKVRPGQGQVNVRTIQVRLDQIR